MKQKKKEEIIQMLHKIQSEKSLDRIHRFVTYIYIYFAGSSD